MGMELRTFIAADSLPFWFCSTVGPLPEVRDGASMIILNAYEPYDPGDPTTMGHVNARGDRTFVPADCFCQRPNVHSQPPPPSCALAACRC